MGTFCNPSVCFFRDPIRGLILVAVLLLGSVSIKTVQAQGTAQVSLIGVPAVLNPPFVGDQVQNLEQGRYLIQFIYTSPQAQPAIFRFRFVLRRDGETLLMIESEPSSFEPGTHTFRLEDSPIRFALSVDEVIDQLGTTLTTQVVQTGLLPEGTYTIEVEPIPEDLSITSLPGSATFVVRYADPPLLVSPADGATVSQPFLVFSWLPVLAPPGTIVEYNLRLVEVLGGQTPLQAIEGNRPHVETTIAQSTTFVYTPDRLPLEEGRLYAWQVTAHAPEGHLPITNEGQSEIYTFTYEMPGQQGEDPAVLATITLEPQFAVLTGLVNLTITEQPDAYVLDGQALLELTFDAGPITLNAEVEALRIQKTGLENPVLLGGTVRSSLENVLLPLDEQTQGWLNLTELIWRFGTGFTAAATVSVAGTTLETSGTLHLGRSGLSGTLTAAGDPLSTWEDPPLALDLARVEAHFPEGTLLAAGRVRLFRQATTCTVDPLVLTVEGILGQFDCNLEQRIPLVASYDVLDLLLDRINGQVHYTLASGTAAYDITTTGSIVLKTLSGPDCSAQVTLGLTHEEGLQVREFLPSCHPAPRINLGLGELALRNFRLPYLRYAPEEGWDFALDLDVDARLRFERPVPDDDAGGFRLPSIEGLRLQPGGIRWPEIEFGEDELVPVPPFRLAGFKIRPLRIYFPAQHFGWEEWQNRTRASDSFAPGSWIFDWDFEWRLDDEPIAEEETGDEQEGALAPPKITLPPCLRDASITVTKARFENGALVATLPATLIPEPGCTVPFGPGFVLGEDYAFTLRELGGSLSGRVGLDGFVHEGEITARGHLTAGSPFACPAEATTRLAETTLRLHANGYFEGVVTDLAPSCPIPIGLFEVQVTEATARFAMGQGGQQARLDGTALLRYEAADGQTLTARGVVGIDMVAAALDTLHLVLEGPFRWGLPAQRPVLSFLLNRAELDLEGLLIDGEQTLQVGEDELAVTFDRVRLGLADGAIRRGAVRFEEAFGFEVAIDEIAGQLTYYTVPVGAPVTRDPALRFDLAGTGLLDSLGLALSGRAHARIHYGGQALDTLTVDYTDGFRLGFHPTRVSAGRADFLLGETRIAWLDAEGFHADPNIFELLIPERLPLPVESVAYLVLKRNGEVLVDVTRLEEGTIRLDTRPGQPLDLVVPALQGTQPQPPTLQIELEDVRFGPFWDYRTGRIHAEVPEGDLAFDLQRLGVPLGLYALGYGTTTVEGLETTSFYLEGTLRLFEQAIAADHPVRFIVRSDRTAAVSVHLDPIDAPVPLVEGENTVFLQLQGVSGWWEGPLDAPGLADFAFALRGNFQIRWEEALAAQAAVEGSFNPNGVVIEAFQPDEATPPATLELNAFALQVDRIKSLYLQYDQQQGFDFYAQLDFTLGFQTADWSFGVPLRGVEVRPDGFHLPAQEVHRHSNPPLVADPFFWEDFRLQPLAVRIPDVTVVWRHLNGREVLSFLPRFDLELTLPGYAVSAPDLAVVSLTLSDVGFTDGILSGSIEPYTFPGEGARLRLGPAEMNPPALLVQHLEGGFFRLETEEGPRQGIDLTARGQLAPLPYVEAEPPCEPPTFALRLTGRGVAGTVDGFQTCGVIPIGPLALAVEEASITFAFGADGQTARVDGTGRLELPPPMASSTPVVARGEVVLDLLTGRLIDGAIALAEPFRWALPSFEQPLFDLTVRQGRFDTAGLWLQGEGALQPAQGASVTVSFEDLRLDPAAGFAIADGRLRLEAQLAFEVHFQHPATWQLVDPATPFEATDAFRLTTTGQAILDRNGIALSGQSTGALRFTAPETPDVQAYPELTLTYTEGFRLALIYNPEALLPVQVAAGRAEFLLNETRIAWLDVEGFHLDPVGLGGAVVALAVPERLGLPTEDVAYLQLRDPATQEPLVSLERNENDTWTLATGPTPVSLVLAGFGADPPKVDVRFSLEVDDGFNVVGGAIEVDLENTPLDMQPFVALPIELTRLTYARGSPYQLTATGRIRLPESLGGLDIRIDTLRFSNRGFAQASVSTGSVPPAYDSTLAPMLSQSFTEGFTVHVLDARVAFGERNELALAGTVESTLLADREGTPKPLFYRMAYTPENGWQVTLDELPELPLGLARFQPEPVGAYPGLAAQLNDEAFRVTLSGVFTMPEVLGQDFAVTVAGLQVGTDGVSAGQVAFTQGQGISLLDEVLHIRLDRLEPSQENGVYRLALDGQARLAYMDDNAAGFTVRNLQVGSDGSFSVGEGTVNLLAEGELVVIEDLLTLTRLELGLNDEGRIRMTLGGRLDVPAPLEGQAELHGTVEVNSQGVVSEAIVEVLATFSSELDNSMLEIPVGDLATLELTGVGTRLDLRHFENTAYFAGAVVYMENSDEKRIWLGEAGNLRERPGVRYAHQEGLTWHVTSTASPENPLFDFEYSFFDFEVHALATYDPHVFGLEIGGALGLAVAGVEGRVGFEGLRVAMPDAQDPSPVKQWPAFTGARFTLMDIVSLELGTFEFEQAPAGSSLPLSITQGSDPENLEETTVQVTSYLRFANSQGAAVRISLGDALAGGIEEVLVYRDVDGNVLLYVKNATIDLAGVGSLNASMRYLQGPSGFSLLVAGGGQLQGLGAIAAAGKFAVLNDRLSMGIFLAVKSEAAIPLIPQAPPVIGLIGVGGGLFLRPEAADLQAVADAVRAMDPALGFMLDQRGLPPTNASFAIMAYASFVLLGQGPISTKEGAIFLELTDQYVNLTASGSYLKQGEHLVGGMTATLNWAQLRIDGRVAVQIGYEPALGGTGDLGFTVVIHTESQQIIWLIDGGLEAAVVGVQAEGNLVVSPAGFYADLQITASYSFAVVRLEGDFFTKVWLILNTNDPLASELGAFAELTLSAEVPGARLMANARGTFVTRGGELSLYAIALAEVEVAFLGRAEVGIFADFRNGRLHDAGILNEVDGAFAELLAEAESAASAMEEQAENARAAAEEARSAYHTQLSDEILAAAGLRLQQLNASPYGQLFSLLLVSSLTHHETLLFTPGNQASLPADWEWVSSNVMMADDRPSRQPIEEAEAQMQTALGAANAQTDAVLEQLDALRAQAITWQQSAQVTLQELDVPVTAGPVEQTIPNGSFTVVATAPFTIDEAKAADQAQRAEEMAAVQRDFAELEAAYLRAIEEVEANLHELETRIEQGALIEQGEQYANAREAVAEYFAREANYYWEAERWARERRAALQARLSGIEAGINQSVSHYETLSSSQAAQRCEAHVNNVWSLECVDRRSLAAVVAARRREFALVLSGSANVSEQVNQYYNTMRGASEDAIQQALEGTAREVWYDMHNLGLDEYATAAEARVGEVIAAHEETEGSLREAHRRYTNALDGLFATKARLTEALYGLIDTYLAARARAGLPMHTSSGTTRTPPQGEASASLATVQALRNRRDALARALEPPVITNITVQARRLGQSHFTGIGSGGSRGTGIGVGFVGMQQYRLGFLNRADISWGATHPIGIANAEVAVVSGTQNTPAGAELLGAVGTRTQFTHWTYKRPAQQGTYIAVPVGQQEVPDTYYARPHTVTVRVRGHGGYTAARVAYFDARTDGPDAEEGWTVGMPPLTTTVTTDDETPPSQPTVVLDTTYVHQNNRYWMHNPTRLVMTLRSVDSESGIHSFEVAIGTSSSSDDIRARAPVTGVRDETSDATQMDVVLRNLNLAPGPKTNYVQVYAKNGAGAYSSPRIVAIRVDETPPVWETATAGRLNRFVRAEAPALPSVVAPVSGSPRWATPRRVQPEPVEAPSSVRISWQPARDPESGIQHYAYTIGTDRRVPYAAFDRPDVPTTGATSVRVQPSYRDSLYVHVRARNHAGLYSDVQTVAYRQPDPTPPAPPTIAAWPRTDLVRVYLPQLAGDPESGIAGYQWTAIQELNSVEELYRRLAASPIVAEEELTGTERDPTPPYFVLRRSDLPHTGSFYLAVRAINGQGKSSTPVIVGPMAFDDTPPVLEGLAVEARQDAVSIRAWGLQDLESGLHRVTYTLLDGPTGQFLSSGTVFEHPENPFADPTPIAVDRSVPLPSDRGPIHSVKLRLTLRNGVGHTASFESEPLMLNPDVLAAIEPPAQVEAVQTGPASKGLVSVTITWQPVQSLYVASYRIERRLGRQQRFTTIAEVNTVSARHATRFEDRSTSDAVYRVVSVNVKGVASPPSTAVPVTVPSPPPAPSATEVRWSTYRDQAVAELTWTPVPEAASYVVERDVSGIGDFEPASDPVAAATFLDANPVEGARYRVRARNVAGVDGPPGAVAVLPPQPLPAPQGLQAVAARDGVALSWQPVAGTAGYHVYRDDTGKGTFSRITSTPVHALELRDHKGSVRSLYYVVAVDSQGRQGYASDIVQVKRTGFSYRR